MAITFVTSGGKGAESNGSITLGWPGASLQNGDVAVAVWHNSLVGVTGTMSSDWSVIAQHSGAGTASRLGAWWHRYNGVTQPSLVVSATGGKTPLGGIAVFRGCKAAGSPIHVAGNPGSGTGVGIIHPSLTTTIDSCMLLLINGSGNDNDRTLLSPFTNALEDAGSGTQNAYLSDLNNPDGSVSLFYKIHGTGATGVFSVAQISANNWTAFQIALEPEPLYYTTLLTDAAPFADLLQRRLQFPRRLSETSLFADLVVSAATVPFITRTVLDTMLFAEATGTALSAVRALLETARFADRADFAAIVPRLMFDALAVVDALSMQAALRRTLADTSILAEATDRTVMAFRSLLDAAGLADLVLRTSEVARTMTDQVAFADRLDRAMALIRGTLDTIVASDRLNLTADIRRMLAEALLIVDLEDRTLITPRQVTDALLVVDHSDETSIIAREVMEALLQTDRTDRTILAIRQALDTFLLSDRTNASLITSQVIVIISDVLALLDQMERALGFTRERVDAPGLSDAFLVMISTPTQPVALPGLPRIRLVDWFTPIVGVAEWLGPRTSIVDLFTPTVGVAEWLGPRTSIVDLFTPTVGMAKVS